MKEEKYNEQYLKMRVAEFINLKNRCRRQWKRIVEESLKIAKQKNLPLEILDLDNLPENVLESSASENIPVYTENGKIQNADVLFRLSRNEYPGLYHKFQKNYGRYKKLEIEMREIDAHFL